MASLQIKLIFSYLQHHFGDRMVFHPKILDKNELRCKINVNYI